MSQTVQQRAFFDDSAEGPFASIVFNRPMDQAFSYRIPARFQGVLKPGQRVRVPLGRGNAPSVGYCVGIEERLGEGVEPSRVKDVLDVMDDPPLIDAPMLELTRWIASYYACAWGQALDAVVPAGVKKGAGTTLKTYLVVPDDVKLKQDTLNLPPKQAEVLALLCRSSSPLSVDDACRLANCRTGPVAALRKAGLVLAVKRRMSKAAVEEAKALAVEAARGPMALTDEQSTVLAQLRPALEADAFSAFLLHGVTGSGKTEVYLSAIEHVVARGREAIVLVPEISLTPQTIRRFKRRFDKVAVLHSHLSDAERHRHWRSIASGDVQVVIGARSAVFAPARKLGLIVIDEEHESTFKQETVPRYHARDVAVMRAHMLGIPIVLGSATPALETWNNAQTGRYTRLTLSKRVADRPMPEVSLIDLRNEKPVPGQAPGGLSSALIDGMKRALDDGGQVILLAQSPRVSHLHSLPAMWSCVQVHLLRRGPDPPQGPHEGALPHLRRRVRPALRLPGLQASEPALRRNRHRAAGARREIGVPRSRRAPDGFRHDAVAGEP